jgi:hypothetical protein
LQKGQAKVVSSLGRGALAGAFAELFRLPIRLAEARAEFGARGEISWCAPKSLAKPNYLPAVKSSRASLT